MPGRRRRDGRSDKKGFFTPPPKHSCIEALAPPRAKMRKKCEAITTPELLSLTAPATFDQSFAPKAVGDASYWLNGPGTSEREGQTFSQFVLYLQKARNSRKITRGKHTLGLMSLGELRRFTVHLPNGSHCLGDILLRSTELFFSLPVRWLDGPSLSSFASRTNEFTNCLQLCTGKMHPKFRATLRDSANSDLFSVVGVTLIDLYPGEDWNFCFGEASPAYGTGVFSFARYTTEFEEYRWSDLNALFDRAVNGGGFEDDEKMNLFPDDEDGQQTAKFVRRCIQVLVHELGHLFGLDHCVFFECVMNGANSLEEGDSQPMHLCPICLKKLHYALRCGRSDEEVDLQKRYVDLAEFYEAIGLVDEAQWYQQRVSSVFPCEQPAE